MEFHILFMVVFKRPLLNMVLIIELLQFINCPVVICLPNMLVIYYGETPLVSCGPRSILLHVLTQSTANTILYIFCKQTSFSILYVYFFVFSKPVRFTTSLLSWGKVFWLCCVQVPRWHRNPWCCAVLHFATNNLQKCLHILLIR